MVFDFILLPNPYYNFFVNEVTQFLQQLSELPFVIKVLHYAMDGIPQPEMFVFVFYVTQ
jgi:hypothetical protein